VLDVVSENVVVEEGESVGAGVDWRCVSGLFEVGVGRGTEVLRG
jgi:hypothetical protein